MIWPPYPREASGLSVTPSSAHRCRWCFALNLALRLLALIVLLALGVFFIPCSDRLQPIERWRCRAPLRSARALDARNFGALRLVILRDQHRSLDRLPPYSLRYTYAGSN